MNYTARHHILYCTALMEACSLRAIGEIEHILILIPLMICHRMGSKSNNNWGFEWDRISKLQKRALRIMTNSKYNAHTEPLFKQLRLLKVNYIFDVQCLKFWYKFVNKKLPNYFRDMFKYNYELHDIFTRSHDRLHLYPTRTSGARNVLRHHIPELLNKFPEYLMDRIKTHSLHSISYHIKCYLIDLYNYDCSIINCYICNNNVWEWQFD